MRIDLGCVSLWFDVSGPSAVPRADAVVERPTLVAVHGGPGSDHINLKDALAPLADHLQVLYYDQRGHGRSDRSGPESWNLQTWASDLRRLCDALGLVKPVILGSSFGGHVVLTYAAAFPGHARGIILANTTGGQPDYQRSVEIFRRLGGDEAAGLHYFRNEVPRFSPWSMLDLITSPALILAGEDDPMCPLPLVEDLASRLPAGTTRLVRLPNARHDIFRDRPDLAFPAIEDFVRQVTDGPPGP
jgi:pimeloyl-ACP methyl ester carboxylesterase